MASIAAATTAGQVITCKAMVQWENGGDLVEETVQVEPPKRGEVRIKILGCGVCHTDWSEPRAYPSSHTPAGSDRPGFPVILGHEGGGIVESVGEGVFSLAPGDYCIPLYTPECRSCKVCTGKRNNGCTATEDTQGLGLMLDGTTRFSTMKDGTRREVLHFMGCSAFSEYTVVNEINCAKVSKDAPLEKVCLLGCGVTTGHGAVLNTCKVEPGSTAAVFGLGGVGLAVVSALKHVGASRIIGVDTNPAKEEQARRLGLTHFINPKTDVVGEGNTVEGKVWETNGGGVDYAFECIGNVKLMESALECTDFGGGTTCIIGVAPGDARLSFRPFHVVCGKVLKGSAFGGTRGRSQLPGYVDSYLAGCPPFVDEFVSATLPYTAVNEAFGAMQAGRVLRSVVTFPHAGDAEVAAHRAAWRPGAIIFLHGLGDVPASWQPAVEWLAGKINKRTVRALSLAAPVMPITKNAGERMTAWFDVRAPWPWTPASVDDAEGVAWSVKQVHAAVDKLVAEGVPAERVIVAGFSQGAVVAAAAVAGYGAKLGGAVCLSGWIPSRDTFRPHAANRETPFFLGHGADDDVVSVDCQRVGAEALRAAGVTRVSAKTYAGLGHDSSEAEMDDVLAFIKESLGVSAPAAK